MAFTGKATYSAGATLPEIAQDVSDLVSIITPSEAALLDTIGDAVSPARSTHHEWLEDELLPNKDSVKTTPSNPTTDTDIEMDNPSYFRVGDQVQIAGDSELMLVTAVDSTDITVVRGYGGTTAQGFQAGDSMNILGNAALEGGDADGARFTTRSRKSNWTQIFSKTVSVSGSDLAVRQLGLADELDFQKAKAMRELLRDLENTVINGIAPESTQEGSATVRRTMGGILPQLTTNSFVPGTGGFPSGSDLDETKLNTALRWIWENSSGQVDLVVVNGFQKRKISRFTSQMQAYAPADETFRQFIGIYESDFGVQKVVLSRWVPASAVLLLDSSRIAVMPLAGRSFHYKPLAAGGDYERGQIIGEYTLEMRNEEAHGCITGLATS
ncbi:MAG: DUF5309 family protein [Planctomycetia bacterium]|nr:DUF5309 family protein [Planctomycetia bacterium]